MNPTNLPDRLRAWRKAKGYTQREAANAFGVKLDNYKTAELGRFTPNGFGLSFILRVLDAHDHENQCPADGKTTGGATTENETTQK
jgi:transcriptional regulator with XRE-family HTH domain